MKKTILTIISMLICVMVNAQSTYDAMAPFGFATRTSRTDASSGAVYNITGGGAVTYEEAKSSASKIVLTSNGTTAMDTEISNAIKNYSVIIFDGSGANGTDFYLSKYISFDGLKNKTLIGVNGARLCTQFYLTSAIQSMLNNYQWEKNGTTYTGVKKGSTSSKSNSFGNLPNGESVGEESEYLTRKALMEYLNDNGENFRKAGVFQFKRCENFIIRNIKFVGPGPCDVGGYDLMAMTESTHFWVDHCDFTDGIDGNFDITNNSDYNTVSWCTFSYTDRAYAHMNTNLVGSSDTDGVVNSEGYYLNTTYAYNHWGNKCDQRMPMARSGKIHMLNNYYTCTNNNSSINPRKNSEFYIEGNYFADGVKKVFSQTDAKAYQWISSGSRANVIASSGVSTPSSSGTVSIPYSYNNTLSASNVPTEVGRWAGATLFQSNQAPTATVSISKTEVKQGAGVVLTAETTGYPEPTIQWYSCSNALKANAQVVGGETNNTYSPSTSTVGGPYYYYAQVTNSEGSATSNVVSFSVVENSDVVWTFTDSDLKANTTWNGNGKNYFIANGSDEELEFYGNSGSNDVLTSSNQTIENVAYTSYLNINSTGTSERRYISFAAPTANGYITVVYAGTARDFTIWDVETGQSLTTISGRANSAVESDLIATTKGHTIKLYASGKVQIYSVIWTPSSGSVTPTPQPTLYTVTYNANGHGTCGTASWTQTSEGQNTTLPSVTTASGYTFLGWATSSSATSAEYNAGASYTPSADVTLYAVYQQEQGGGYTQTNVSEAKTWDWSKISGDNIQWSASTTPSNTTEVVMKNISGLTFDPSFDAQAIVVKGEYPYRNKTTQNTTIKFHTTVAGTISVDFSDTGSSISSGSTAERRYLNVNGTNTSYYTQRTGSSNDKKTGCEVDVDAGDVVITGKKEDGTSASAIIIYKIVFTPASTPTPQTYTVSYNLNGHGDAIADVVGVTALPSTLPTPTATGYTFGGWYTDNDLTTPAAAGAAISANTTLYAKWTSSSSTDLSSLTWAEVCNGKMGDTWYGTDEAQSVADIVLAVQKNNGGWMKNDQLHKLTTDQYNTLVDAKGEHSCFDNYATTQEMRFLLKVYNATHVQKYLTAFKSALDLIITAGQGKQGGWGQYWPNSGGDSYQDYITFNDDLMTNVMKMLQNVYEAKGEYAGIVDDATKASCKTAWDAAILCVLNCQIDDNGTKAIWCAQHDPADFLPAEGRPHEMPSAGPYESSNLLSYLMSIKNPSEALKTSIRAAVEWMKNHKSFENKAVEDYTNSSGVADRHIIDKQGSNLWGRFIQIGGASGTAIYNKLWNKLKTRGKKRAHHTTGTEYYEYQLLDASYDASKAYKPIYAIYTNDYPELFYRHLYNYDDTPDATDKYGALVATSLKAANRRSYQYLGSWPDAIINTEYPAWEAGLTESDFGGTLTDEEISPATYSSSSGSTWNFSDGFVVTSSSGDYATGNNNTVKYGTKEYTITIPAGYTVKKVSFTGYDNYDTADSYISKFNGTSYNSTQYVFPAKDGTTAIYATHRFDLSSSPVTGSLTFSIAGKQTCLRIHLYCTTGDDDNPAVSDEKTFTFTPTDGTTTKDGGTYTRTSVENSGFSISSGSNINSDSRFKLSEGATYYLNVPSNATVTKVEFTNCSENYYNNPNSGDNNTTTFTVASDGATVVTKDKNGNVLQYLSTGQLITSTLANHVTGTPISFTASGGKQLAFGSIVVYYTLTDKGSVNLLSQTISNGASVNRNGSVTFVFDDDVSLVNNAKIKVNGNDVRTEASGSSVTGYFWGLTYGSIGNTITLAANSVQDGFGNKYAEPVSITFNVNSKTPVTKKAFDYIVGRDGATVDAAVTAINNASGTDRYYVFIPDGEYEMAGNQLNKMTWITRANVSLIGQSQNGTILKNTPTSAGISTTSTIEFRGGSNNNYVQDLTLKNQLDYGASGSYGVGVAFYDRGQKNILKNVSLLSNQDTYTSAGSRGYFENCKIAGTVDFICGSGDYYFNGCNLIINDRTTANVITAPSTLASERWGYVFESCTISAENDAAVTHQGGKYHLGRPWKDAPASTFLNTTLNLLPANAGWTNMENGLAVRFHEYGSKNSSGTALSLSSRSVSACNGATADNPVLTAAQAAEYTMHNVIGGTDGFDPTEYTGQVAVANAHLAGSTLTWDNSDDALCWIVFKDGAYYANPITNSLELTVEGTYTVRAANAMGGLGEASVGVQYVDISAGGAVLAFTASVQGGSNAAGSFVNQETHYYNNWGTSGWAAQAYIGFNVALPAGKQVKSATLKYSGKVVGGSAASYTATVRCLTADQTAAFDYGNLTLSAAKGDNVVTVTDYRADYTRHNIPVSAEIMQARTTTGSTSLVIFQIGGSGGALMYGYASASAPTLDVEFEDIPTPVYTVNFTNEGSQYGEIQNIEKGQTVSAPSPAPTKTDYTFRGWSLTNGGTTAEVFPYTVTADVNFYAIWEQNQHGGETSNTTNYDAYAYHQSKIIADACPTDNLEGISITYGTSEWTVTGGDGKGITCGDDVYTGLVSASSNGSYSANTSITSGAIVLQPGYNGTISLAIVVNADKAFYIVDETTKSLVTNLTTTCYYSDCHEPHLYYSATNNKFYEESTYTTTHKLYGTVQFTVEAGHRYSIGVSGSKMGLYGFNYEYTIPTSVTATVASTRKFGSFSSVYNVDFGDDENADVKAYTAVVDGTSVNLTRHTGVLPAGEGVVLYAPGATKSQTFNVVSEATALTVGNDMIGVPVDTYVYKTVDSKRAYVVNSDAFKPIAADGTIAAGKAYIRISEAQVQQGRTFTMTFNDWTTGISDSVVESNEPEMKIYNLQGIEVKTPVKGRIYIINNKKCLFK